MSSLFDVDDRKFTTVSCMRCGYTEFYRVADPRAIVQIMELFAG